MLRRSLFALMVAAIVGTHPSAFLAQPSATPDVDALGPQVGSRIPDFTLPDQHGRQQSLSTLRGPKGLVLVFSRSADWLPARPSHPGLDRADYALVFRRPPG